MLLLFLIGAVSYSIASEPDELAQIREAIEIEITQGIFDTDEKEELLDRHSEQIEAHIQMEYNNRLQAKNDLLSSQTAVEEKFQKLQDLLSLSISERSTLENYGGLGEQKHDQLEKIVEQQLDDLYGSNLNDQEQIEEIIGNLFFLKETNFREKQDFDFQKLFSPQKKLTAGQQYFINRCSLQRRAEQIYRENQNYENNLGYRGINIENIRLELVDDTAIALVDIQEFDLRQEGAVGYAWYTYTISFENVADRWFIADVFSDDAQEIFYRENGLDLNVEERLDALRQPLESVDNSLKEQLQTRSQEDRNDSGATRGQINYIRSYAVSYAKQYSANSTGNSSYNSNFLLCSGNDCQNFAAQCVWFGFGGINTSSYINSKASPMIATGTREWWCTKTDACGSNTSDSYWTYVSAFMNYINGPGAGYNPGPYGYNYNGVAYSDIGDVIQVSWSGNSSYNHAYVVSGVTSGTSLGSRTVADIKICAHTTNHKDWALSNENLDASYFRTARIQAYLT